MHNQFKLVSIALISGAVLMACQEDENLSTDTVALDETTFVENALAEISDDVTSAEEVAQPFFPRVGHFGLGKTANECAMVTEDVPESDGFPRVITIDYGDGCESAFRDIVKAGTIVITITGERGEAGSERVTSFENFSVNGYQINGLRTFTYNGDGAYTERLENGMITTPDGQTITFEANRSKDLIEGADTEERLDDVWQITGSSSGTNAEGAVYSKTITNPLIRPVECGYITSGTIETSVDGVPSVLVDFGDGTCDQLVTRTEDGVTEEFTMECRMRRFGRRGSR